MVLAVLRLSAYCTAFTTMLQLMTKSSIKIKHITYSNYQQMAVYTEYYITADVKDFNFVLHYLTIKTSLSLIQLISQSVNQSNTHLYTDKPVTNK